MQKCYNCEKLTLLITRYGFQPECKLNKRKFKEINRWDPDDPIFQNLCPIVKNKKENKMIIDYPDIIDEKLLSKNKEELYKISDSFIKLKEIAFKHDVPIIINKQQVRIKK